MNYMKGHRQDRLSVAHRDLRLSAMAMAPFICPDNDVLSPTYKDSPIKGVYRMISYNTASLFLHNTYRFLKNDKAHGGTYVPMINKVGLTSAKLFLSDGGKYCADGTTPPDYNESFNPTSSSNPQGDLSSDFADEGPMSTYSKAFVRTIRHSLFNETWGTKVGMAF